MCTTNVSDSEKWQMTLSSHMKPFLQAKITNPKDVTTTSFNNASRETTVPCYHG